MTPSIPKNQAFIERAMQAFPEYDYSKVEYRNSKTPVLVGCPIHGYFEVIPERLTFYGRGCPHCKVKSKTKGSNKAIDTTEVIRRFEEKHHGRYDYSQVVYKTMKTPVTIICRTHGPFTQLPENHIHKSCGCPQCAIIENAERRKDTKESYIQKCIVKFGPDIAKEYDFSQIEYIDSYTKVKFMHNECGNVFEMTPVNFLNGQRCPNCKPKTPALTTDEFLQRAIEFHNKLQPNKQFLYDRCYYSGHNCKVIIGCPIHGYFTTYAANWINKGRNPDCPHCTQIRLKGMQTSGKEKEIYQFVKSLTNNVEENNRTIINNQEIDIYIPEKQLAIEFDGLYFHSNVFKDEFYHLSKTEVCESNKIQLLHIFESDWTNYQDITKSRLSHLLGKSKYKIYARNCYVKETTAFYEDKFLEQNHFQGYIKSTKAYGLHYKHSNGKEYLIALMTFKKITDNKWEMLRFCTKINFNVPGAVGKLFKHFVNKHQPQTVITFADRRWVTNVKSNMYEKIGFKLESFEDPKLYYISGYSLYEYQTKNEQRTIYDCGQLKYVWRNSQK